MKKMLHYAHEINKAEQMQNNQPAQAHCHSTETFARVDKQASTARANQSMYSPARAVTAQMNSISCCVCTCFNTQQVELNFFNRIVRKKQK